MRPRVELPLARRLDALLRPAFLAALGLLVLNDGLLKPLFHNALTGKLSDFAGVFAFAYACTVVAGRRAAQSGPPSASRLPSISSAISPIMKCCPKRHCN